MLMYNTLFITNTFICNQHALLSGKAFQPLTSVNVTSQNVYIKPRLFFMQTENKIVPTYPYIHAAAVLYTPQSQGQSLLRDFAQNMQSRGWKVGGVVQDILRDATGTKTGVDAISLDNNDRFPIVRPSKEDIDNGTCGLDRSVLSLSSVALKRAIDNKVDLLIVEKFGEREQLGEGLADDIMTAMANGIPVLVAVPAYALETWNDFTGGLAALLPANMDALHHWWPKEKMYDELISNIPDTPVKTVTMGLNWTLVETADGCGLAHTPARGAAGCRNVPFANDIASKSLKEMAKLALSWNPFDAALGIAAINAHYNSPDIPGADTNGMDMISPADTSVAVIGGFKNIKEKFEDARVIEITPTDQQFPQSAATQILKSSEAAIITASTFGNKTLPDLLEAARHCETVLLGPGTPLAPLLHSYGIDILSGLVVEDADAVRAVVAAGGSVKDIKPYCRYVTLQK